MNKLIYVFVFLVIGIFLISGCAQTKGKQVVTSYTNCTDSDDGWDYTLQGSVTLTGPEEERISGDYCRDENLLVEYNCGTRYGGPIALNRVIYCDREFGENVTCLDGRCAW